MSKLAKKAVDIIRDAGLKPTAQRVEILEYLYSNENYQSIDNIYNNLLKSYKVFSKATIYATLEAFVEKGIVTRFSGMNGEARIDISGDNQSHFICTGCGCIQMVNTYSLDDDITRNRLDCLVTSKETTYKGLCTKCRKDKLQG